MNLVQAIAAGSTVTLLAILAYQIAFVEDLDSDANHGPLASRDMQIVETLERPKELLLAASISHDPFQDRFFVSTDEPHTLFPKHEAMFFVMDSSFSQIKQTLPIKSDSDLEGIAAMGKANWLL